MRSTFWDDHEQKLDDPEYARAFAAESIRVATIDSIMNTIVDGLEAAGMSKAALARMIGANPAAVRRLLSSGDVNPTLGTLAEIAGALGLKVTLEPMTSAERQLFTDPMTRSESTAEPAQSTAGPSHDTDRDRAKLTANRHGRAKRASLPV